MSVEEVYTGICFARTEWLDATDINVLYIICIPGSSELHTKCLITARSQLEYCNANPNTDRYVIITSSREKKRGEESSKKSFHWQLALLTTLE